MVRTGGGGVHTLDEPTDGDTPAGDVDEEMEPSVARSHGDDVEKHRWNLLAGYSNASFPHHDQPLHLASAASHWHNCE